MAGNGRGRAASQTGARAPTRKRPGRTRVARLATRCARAATVTARKPSAEVEGAYDVTLAYGKNWSVIARNIHSPPAVGETWPGGVWYHEGKPTDAAVREPVIFWNDVAIMASLCTLCIGLWLLDRHKSREEDDAEVEDDE